MNHRTCQRWKENVCAGRLLDLPGLLCPLLVAPSTSVSPLNESNSSAFPRGVLQSSLLKMGDSQSGTKNQTSLRKQPARHGLPCRDRRPDELVRTHCTHLFPNQTLFCSQLPASNVWADLLISSLHPSMGFRRCTGYM